uniref:Uncharacterized protein n=1 Tax=viral metagenome TaxID=1070528 RepID=A0A6C0C979_9ZZZZ
MNPVILAESKLLMSPVAREVYYYKCLRKVFAYVWSLKGTFGVKFHCGKESGCLYISLFHNIFVSCSFDGNKVQYETKRSGFECLVTPIKEFPDDELPCYYQISGYGPIKSITECFTNVDIIRCMFLTIQNIRSSFVLEAGQSKISQSEIDEALITALKYAEIDIVSEMTKIRETMKHTIFIQPLNNAFIV